MFKKKSDTEATVKDLITHVNTQTLQYDYETEQFDLGVKQLERLHKLLPDNKGKRVSADAALAVAGNLLGIVLILTHEQTRPIATKALGFVTKTRF